MAPRKNSAPNPIPRAPARPVRDSTQSGSSFLSSGSYPAPVLNAAAVGEVSLRIERPLNSMNLNDTPAKGSSHHLQRPMNAAAAALKPTVNAELSGNVIENSETDNKSIYECYDTPEIQTFVNSSKLYQKKAWTEVKKIGGQAHFYEKDLYKPFAKIIETILKHFHADKAHGRKVVDTHKAYMQHSEDDATYFVIQADGTSKILNDVKTSPDLTIFGNGPYFTKDGGDKPRYDHCIAPVEIKRDQDLNLSDVTAQVGVYVRQCFIQQPNRRYVPAVVLTNKRLYLFVFDRSGSMRSRAIDFHAEPQTFVRIIIGISSVDGNLRNSPFDHRLTWPTSVSFNTQSLILCNITVTRKPQGRRTNTIVEEYIVTGKPFQRRSIIGRGTTCWVTETPTEGRVLIKESWRPANRPSEWDFRKEIKDLPGVGQILSFEEDKDGKISDFRNFIFAGLYTKSPYDDDRIFSRLVLKAYGRSIRYFKTHMQLLEAFRDAVAGHKGLWLKGILHRDVSVDNVLLGRDGAAEGYRGILIDLDMAIRISKEPRGLGRCRTGTRAFQSVAVLSAGDWRQAPPQDHLDDLESYLYVLAWVCHKYDGTGSGVSSSPRFLDKWEVNDAQDCANAKIAYLGVPTMELPPHFCTPIFETLLIDLGALCQGWVNEKRRRVIKSATVPFPSVYDLLQRDQLAHGKAHDEFLAIIDTAIRDQRSADKKARQLPRNPVPQPNPASQPVGETSRPGRSSQKRAAPDATPQAATAGPSKRMKSTGSDHGSLANNAPVRRSTRLAASKTEENLA